MEKWAISSLSLASLTAVLVFRSTATGLTNMVSKILLVVFLILFAVLAMVGRKQAN